MTAPSYNVGHALTALRDMREYLATTRPAVDAMRLPREHAEALIGLADVLCEQLWPDGDLDAEWTVETIEYVAEHIATFRRPL